MNNRFKNNNWFARNSKLIFLVIYVIVFVSLSVLILYKGFDIIKTKNVVYVNNSSIDYFVYLKENNYFDVPYLNKGEKYIASLIDKVNIKYNYNLSSEDKMNGSYTYNLVATLLVTEQGKDDVLWKNNYDLSNKETVNFEEQNTIEVNQDVNINYDYYNDIVASFKKDYGVAIDANLLVKLVVNTNLDYENDSFVIEQEPLVNIPLSEQTLEIDFSVVEDDINTNTVTYTKYPALNYFLIVIGIIFLIIYLILGIKVLFKIIRAIKKRDKYDLYLRKIFSNYDQIIINSSKVPDLENVDILEVSSFEELVDAQNEIHKPIIFNEIKKGKEAVFILVDDKRAYFYTVLSSDFKK